MSRWTIGVAVALVLGLAVTVGTVLYVGVGHVWSAVERVGPTGFLQADITDQPGDAMRVNAAEIGAKQGDGRGVCIRVGTAYFFKNIDREIQQLIIGDHRLFYVHPAKIRSSSPPDPSG